MLVVGETVNARFIVRVLGVLDVMGGRRGVKVQMCESGKVALLRSKPRGLGGRFVNVNVNGRHDGRSKGDGSRKV